ncbi:MAG TPA: DUF1800 family protein [Candidatus Sulfotelmatobacter sp.]|nr:DUF1800 family protein [Candidatus Sulfotelmatobacter sp.]
MAVKRLWSTQAVLLLLLLSGCTGLGTRHGSDGSPLPPDSSGTGVTVTPATATIRAGSNEAFAATVSGSTNTSVTWSVNSIAGGNATVGTIDANGMYTAPASLPTPNTITVAATSTDDATKKGSSAVTLQNPIPVLTSVTPAAISTGAFSLTLTGSGFVKNSTVTFGGQMLTTTYVSPTELQASGTAAPTQIGTVNIVVQNPDPGAAVSSAMTASVVAASQPVSQAAAVRFLEQSTFGPTTSLVSQVAQNGFDIFLQSQFTAPASTYPTPLPTDSGVTKVQNQFFINAVNDSDQLRERVAFALNEIWVVSQNKVSDPTGYTNYMAVLTNDALGNYYNVMKDVTLTPAMGHYLDMVNNDKPATGQHANENYARELMQLFTLGLSTLNSDGTAQVDGSGNPVPTYKQNDVMALGRSFTGWTFPTEPGGSLTRHNPEFYGGNMVPFESNHDSGSKTFLGQPIPAGQSAEQELDTALTIIFNHPNMPPFVAQQLIEKLVTSNPSPAYVARVASAFSAGKFQTYGTGKRGDMQATVAAILLDPEARRGDSSNSAVASDGKQREPVVMMVSVARMFNPTTDGTGFVNWGGNMGQSLFNAGSVFNFFPPQNLIAGTTLNGPEFAIFNTNTALARANFVNTIAGGSISSGTKVDFTPVINAGSQDAMLDWLNTYLLHGTMSSQMKQSVLTAMSAAGTNTKNQAKMALYLVVSSSQYQVQR